MSSIKCPKCDKRVWDNQNLIYCDSCHFWLHLKCSSLKKEEFDYLSENPSSLRFCCYCVKNIFPFHKLTDVRLLKELAKNVSVWQKARYPVETANTSSIKNALNSTLFV